MVVQGLALAPDDGEGGGDVGGPRGVGELHLVTVDGVTQQLGIHTRHSALYVELAHEPDDKSNSCADENIFETLMAFAGTQRILDSLKNLLKGLLNS